jgi:ABC-2 type transport system ATP-binding protein
MQNVVEVENVSKKFRYRGKNFHALRDVSFSIKKGEIFGLLGPNGAGKTTMLNIILGILEQDSGDVRLFGRRVCPDVLEKMNIVASDIRFHWVLRPKDILEFYGRVYGLDAEERGRQMEKLSRVFGIEDAMYRRFIYLSTGERMRLNFAKALLNKPELLLLDEPTLGLDPDMAIKVRSEIMRVNRKFHTTVLLTSHYMHEAEQLCDRIAFVHHGRVVDTGSVDKVKLANFGTYELIVEVAAVKSHGMLRKHGFRISGNVLRKNVRSDENMSVPLALLAKLGIRVTDVETKRPTLEDYFVKMTANSRRNFATDETGEEHEAV